MERFFLNQKLEDHQQIEITDPDIIHKISHVLRAKVQDRIVLFNNNGSEFIAEIKGFAKDVIKLELQNAIDPKTEPALEINLYCGLIKKNHFEIALEKCTEIGVSNFFPIISERAVVQTETIPERWEKIIIEAAQQSGRVKIPKIYDPEHLDSALARLKKENAQIILASESDGSQDIPGSIAKLDPAKPINLFIGPEGGWSNAEIKAFEELRPIQLNLGSRILRSETAAMVFSALCIYLIKGN